jgi:hypothetical protein
VTRRSASPQKPHTRKKAAREKTTTSIYEPDREWADGIWKSLLAGCHPLQYDAVIDPARRYSYCVGRGGAKTTSFRVRGVRVLTNKPRASVLYFASTRQRAKDLMWSPLKALLQKLGLEGGEDVTFNETELRCTIIRTGSTYQLSGLQDIADADKWRGSTFDEVQFDECGAIKPSLLEYTVFQVIGPRVRCLGLGGTPGRDRRGLFYESTRPGSEKHRPYAEREKYPEHRGYSSHHWTLEDVLKLPDAAEKYPALAELWEEAQIEKADNKWSDDNPIWLREYKAIWATDGTMRVFGAFRPHLDDGAPWNIWDPFDGKGLIEGVAGLKLALAALKKANPQFTDWRFVVPMDSGHKDPFACSVFAFSPHDTQRRKWQCMSFERTGMGYGKPIAELLLGADQVDVYIKTGAFPTKYGGVFGEIGWPDGIVIDTDNALLEDLKNVYGIKAKKADKKPEYKAGAIELANGEFTDGRMFVLLGSPMHEQLEQLQWREQDNGKLAEDTAQANHSSDLVVYGLREIATLFESGQVAQDAKPASSGYSDPMGLDPRIAMVPDAKDDAMLAPSEWTDDEDGWT